MGDGGITVNGQHYDSVDALPPDVRRIYDQAMKTIQPSQAGGQGSETTEVIHGPSGFGIRTNIVVRKKITVNNKTYGSVDEMPPDVRRLVERAVPQTPGAGGGTPTTPGVHVWLNVSRPQAPTITNSGAPAPMLTRPIEPPSTEASLRHVLTVLAFLILGALGVWVLFGR